MRAELDQDARLGSMRQSHSHHQVHRGRSTTKMDATMVSTQRAASALRRETSSTQDGGRVGRRKNRGRLGRRAVMLAMLSAAPALVSAECFSLQGSTTCRAFGNAQVSNDPFLAGLFPFLQFVTSTQTFDQQFRLYMETTYIREKYQTLLGCSNVNFSRTSELYARFTTTVLCNAIIQNSISACGLAPADSKPVCADTCAQFAQSEAFVSADPSLCSTPGNNLIPQIRADFTNCALPAGSLSSANCIQGIANEPENCGYGNSTIGLCSYCSSGGINSTDTCCYNSNVQERCAGVVLPSITPTMTFTTPTPTATPTATPAPASGGLSGGAIAGIVVGSVAGVALLILLLLVCLRLWRRRRGSQNGSILNQPSPVRKGPVPMQQQQQPPPGFETLPGGRIARMSALEGHSGGSPSHHGTTAAAVGAAAFIPSRRRADNHSSSDEFGDSPESDHRAGVLRPPPATVGIRRNGSLSSGSVLAGEDPNSPTSAGGMSSPQGMASQQSEQLPFFKDYYSQDDIHPGDRVAVLWAYQPRAADEFALERGDMLKVVGIWDDGWATGIMLDERADEWEARRQAQRDSGVSNTSGRRDTSPPVSGEIKAFPLVCVCLPEHWRKTIEGDGSTETGSSGNHGAHSTIS